MLAVTVVGILGGAGSLVMRFRRAPGRGAPAASLDAPGAALTGVGMLASVVLVAAGNQVLVGWVGGVCVALLPLAIGAAVLRYRLFDLDRIISRTLAYGLLTVILVCYVAGSLLFVLVAGAARTPELAGCRRDPGGGSVRPARRRVQAVVDRRFNRRRYNAARTIATFSIRLRDEVDLDSLTGELLAVVDQTMQPTMAWCGCGRSRHRERLRPSEPGNASEDATSANQWPAPGAVDLRPWSWLPSWVVTRPGSDCR